MKKNRLLCFVFFLFLVIGSVGHSAESDESIGIAIVYDTSGSMDEAVRDGSGKTSAKYIVANRALIAVIDRLEGVAAKKTRKIQCSIVTFNGSTGREVIPFGDFEANRMRQWVKGFSKPTGGTPLGEAIQVAGNSLLKSNSKYKHILVLSDGISNVGIDPSAAISKLKTAAEKNGTGLSFHFIAFDVSASVFAPVKKLGATVVAASDEKELNAQLSFILEKKILLEDEEPPVKKEKK